MPYVHPTVLVVDDNEDTRIAVTTFFRAAGYGVETACDGREGLRVMRQTHPCIVLLDLQMPDMSGPHFRQEQLADAELKDIPVVVFSASGDIKQAAERMAVSAIAQKPIQLSRLMALVNEHCLK